ncbi:MAG: alpha/beta fold hydrolase [Nocardioides sp.]
MIAVGRRGLLTALTFLLGCALIGWLLVWPRYAAYRERHRTVAPDSSLADQCNPADIEVPDSARRIVLTAEDGTRLGGAVVGVDDARTAVLLRQGAGQRICQWLPFAERLASEAGVQVVLFDRRGRGSSPGEENLSKEPGDLQTASDWATSHGASRIVLLASSMGNSVMFSALPEILPAPCGVVAISPVLTSADSHGAVDGTAPTRLPQHFATVYEEPLGGSVEYLAKAAAKEEVELTRLALPTGDHSLQLILRHAEAQTFVIDQVRSCA